PEGDTQAADKSGVVQSPSGKAEAGDEASRIRIREEGISGIESLPAICHCHWAEAEAHPNGTEGVWEFGRKAAGLSHLHSDETPAEEEVLSFLHSPGRSSEMSTRQSPARVTHAEEERRPITR
ncbi:PDE9A, partial [Symbiodinium sp. CCMP2456]